jgi:aminoglycoside 3-N-acetyltransferase
VITAADITTALAGLGVDRSDTLFVHSDVSRCLRVAGATREQKLEEIIRGLANSVSGGTLIMPAFTYSFCRGEVFDRGRSPSTVGVLGEHFRGQLGVRRTADPIFSTSVYGSVLADWERDLFSVSDKDCFGPRSIFAYLMEVDAQHVCLGRTACTLIHHIEQCEGVPYRYFKDFRGVVADGAELAHTTARYFVRPLDSSFDADVEPLARMMNQSGQARATRLERGPTVCVARVSAIGEAAIRGLRADPSFLLKRSDPQLVHSRPA